MKRLCVVFLLIFSLCCCFNVYEMETYKSTDSYKEVFQGNYTPKDVN